jgi:hypothetical protein
LKRASASTVFVVFSLVASAAIAAPPSRIGLVVTLGVNISHDETTKVTHQLGEALHEATHLDVVSGYDVTRRLPPGGLREDCVAKKECIKDLGSRLEADQLLFLVIVRVGARVQIDSTWAETATGKTVPRDAILFEERGIARKEVFAKAAKRLIPPPEPEKKPEVVEKKPTVTATVAAVPDKPKPKPPTQNLIESFMEANPRLTSTPILISAGVGTVALLGGVIFGFSAKSAYDSLSTSMCNRVNQFNRPQCSTDTLKTDDLLADVFFGTAIVSAGAAVAFYYLLPPTVKDETPHASIQLGAGKTGATIGISGSF